MTKFITVFILSVFFILFASCNSVSPELKTAEQLIESAPDSALQILRNMPPQKYKNPKNRALYGLLMVQALDKKMLPLKPDSLLDFSLTYYQEYPDHDRLATCYLYKGRTYKYYLQYEKAIEYYLKALETIHYKNNYLLLARINSDLGDIYLVQGEYLKARKKYKLTYQDLQKGKLYNYAYYSLIDIGKTYYMLNDYDIAQKYFRYVYFKAKDSLTIGAALHETGLCYYQSNQNDSAISYFRKVLYYPYIGCNKAVSYYYLGNIFYKLNIIDSAYYYAKKSFNFKPDIRTQRECYRILTNSEFLKGNMQSMSEFMNKYVQLSDSLRKIDAQTKGSYIETVHTTKIEAAQNKNRVMYLTFITVLILIGSYLFNRIVLRRNKKEKLHIQEIHLLEKADIHNRVIVDKRIIIHQKIEERKAKITSERKGINLQEREDLIKEIYNEILHINDLKFFFGEMDIDFNNLVTKLQSRYKGINEKELIWCCLNLLKIPNHDLLILLNYKTQNSLKILKSRLSVKFKLDNAKQLSEFLINILAEE